MRSAHRYRKARAAVRDRSRGRCEAYTRVCTFTGNQAHHIKTRARGGDDSPQNLLWLCSACHRFIHEHPEWSAEHGFLRHSWETV